MEPLTVAVDAELTPVADALKAAGFRVVGLDADLGRVQAVVVDGMEKRFLGMNRPSTPAPVIEARGLSAQQVVAEVRRRAARPDLPS
ncbi:MAG: YkuS family protein [Actinomycetia bacterium]|nr:YkuS family protein [Actinomycetes bacterium]